MKTFVEFLIELSLGKAGVFADNAHKGQHRKTSGAPYIIHPTAVVRILQKLGVKDKNILVAAYLHDVLENSSISYNDIKREFNKEISQLVKEVTSNKKGITVYGKPKYLAHKMIKSSDAGLIIKLADRAHNISDLSSMKQDKAQAYADQTFFIIAELKEKRQLNKYHKKLIKILNKSLTKYKKQVHTL